MRLFGTSKAFICEGESLNFHYVEPSTAFICIYNFICYTSASFATMMARNARLISLLLARNLCNELSKQASPWLKRPAVNHASPMQD